MRSQIVRIIALLLPACGWLPLEARPPRNDLERVTQLLVTLERDACELKAHGIIDEPSPGRPSTHSAAFEAWFNGGKCLGFTQALLGRIYAHRPASDVQLEITAVQDAVNNIEASALAGDLPILKLSVIYFVQVQQRYLAFLATHPEYTQ